MEAEVQEMLQKYDNVILAGDFNIHHQVWLKYSREDLGMGSRLKDICDTSGLKQVVKEPIRGEYLLDLMLTNRSDVRIRVLSKIADHCGLLITVPDKLDVKEYKPRDVWIFKEANWIEISRVLQETDWSVLHGGSVNDAVNYFYQVLRNVMHAHIPCVTMPFQKSSVPWLNDKCKLAIARKHAAEGTRLYEQERDKCQDVLREEKQKHIIKLRTKMQELPQGSKRWWSIHKEMMHHNHSPSFLPPVQNTSRAWCKEPSEKANAFAKAWEAKNELPPPIIDQFFAPAPSCLPDWIPIRARSARRLLLALRLDQATGPDGIGAFFLREVAKIIDVPLAILCRRILYEGEWPECWRLHAIIPIFKRGSHFDPNQYRGIHLTAVLSKTIERMIGETLVPFLEQRSFGHCQWAFRKRCSARDLVTVCIFECVRLICKGRKVGLYLSDISGAFDKVSRCLLMGKLSETGLPDSFLQFLNSYLMPREGKVTVEDAVSEAFTLADMVFQGTVLGPPLWNTFFADVAKDIAAPGQDVQLFADDLTVLTSCPLIVSNAILLGALGETQKRTHRWGVKNQVSFDPSKETFKVLHPTHGEGEPFKLLGTLLDCKLKMVPCIEKLFSKVRPKIRALRRLSRAFSVKTMLNQYKAHVWSQCEYHDGALILACDTQLARFDSMQRGYLQEFSITDTEAFVEYNFAPPSIRRRIGMLGFLHKCVLCAGHQICQSCFQERRTGRGTAMN